MPKKGKPFVCQNCSQTFSKWSGRCENCGEWNSLIESAEAATSKGTVQTPTSLSSVSVKDTSKTRFLTGFADIDAVLGGGLVPGSVTLLAGEPGMGKSTLALQLAGTATTAKQKVLYVSGEESLHQIQLRAQRLFSQSLDIDMLASTSTDDIAATLAADNYDIAVIDSIQTLAVADVASSPGSVSQITNSTHVLTRVAKQHNIATILIGHVTKQGSIAGPKVLEHVVDVVLQLEGDRYGGFKMLRAIKNRFGSTSEAAVLEMKQSGLQIVDNPSALLLEERQVSDGSVVLATIEGTRPILVEVQALVSASNFGYPKRTASGFDLNRLTLLVAVLSRRTKLNLADKDVYINIVGGLKINDPAADLAVCMAIASATKGMALKDDAVVFGEVGLSGEIRHVQSVDARVSEAKKLGFNYAIGPKSSGKQTYIKSVTNLKDALNSFLAKG